MRSQWRVIAIKKKDKKSFNENIQISKLFLKNRHVHSILYWATSIIQLPESPRIQLIQLSDFTS